MAFEINPYPEFSWSISRQRLFDQCPRAYYYRYYQSHNGWLREASDSARVAYRLSKLTSLDALFGQEMDDRAREIEAAVRAGHALPTCQDLEERTRKALNEAWRSSRDLVGFEASPKRVTMLRTAYLGEDAAPEVARVKEKLGSCLQNLLAVPHWERIAACGADGCVLIPDFAHCIVGGVKVFAAADLAYVHDGTLHVIDWKSGREGDDHHLQVLLSAFCLRESESGLGGTSAEGHVHYLATGEGADVTIPDDLADLVRATVEDGVRRMRGYLCDPEYNAPLDLEEFERRESALCASCNFGRLCEAAGR